MPKVFPAPDKQPETPAPQPQRHRERLGTLQEHNFAANPMSGFCRRCCKGEAARRRRGLGQLPESRYRARWISRGIRRCPCRDAVAKTEVVEDGAGRGDWSSVRYGLGICRECSSNSTWREHSHRRRRGCGGTSSHTDHPRASSRRPEWPEHVAHCRIAAHHTHVGRRGAHLKYQERTVAICVSQRPGLFTERYFHHGIDLNAQVGTYNVTSNRVGPGLSRNRKK